MSSLTGTDAGVAVDQAGDRGRWRVRWWRVTLATAFAACLAVVGSPAVAQVSPPPDAGPCNPQVQALYATSQAIARHNAQPHLFQVPRQQAALAAYNAEAAQLDAAQDGARANLASCLSALESLAGVDLAIPQEFGTTPTPLTRGQLDRARAAVPQGYREPAPPPGTRWQVPTASPLRPLYDVLRGASPTKQLARSETVRLQGRTRPRVGDPDPSRPGRVILGTELANGRVRSTVSPDHIVSLAEIVTLPGFARLTPENMLLVANAPANLQWLSWETNMAKSSRSARDLAGIDPAWQQTQSRLEDRVRALLIRTIDQLLRSQG
jgi:hypothetical protein